MTARESVSRSAGLAVYLAAIAGVGVLTLKLVAVLAAQSIALSEPLFSGRCCVIPLVEQRRLAQAASLPLGEAKPLVAALEAPAMSIGTLAAQLDAAEGVDVPAARIDPAPAPRPLPASLRISHRAR